MISSARVITLVTVVCAMVALPSSATRFNSVPTEADPGSTIGEEFDQSASSTPVLDTLREFDVSHQTGPSEYELPATNRPEESAQGWDVPDAPADGTYDPGTQGRYHQAAGADDGEPIPEPATLTLLGMGLIGAAWRIRRRKTA